MGAKADALQADIEARLRAYYSSDEYRQRVEESAPGVDPEIIDSIIEQVAELSIDISYAAEPIVNFLVDEGLITES